MQLSKKFVMALIPFLTPNLTTEAFHDMYLCCCEVKVSHHDFSKRVGDLILKERKVMAAKNAVLYKKAGNIQLDHCIGDTKMLMSERIDLSGWDEWER